MKKKILLFILLSLSSVNAEELQLTNISFQTENDADIRDDAAYSYGGSISALFYRKGSQNSFFHIPFTPYARSNNYFSLRFAHQLYTPENLKDANLIEDDRPYAGYMYLESGLHQSYKNTLESLIFSIGVVGPSSKMQSVQEFIHDLIGSPYPQGWKYQLKDELTLQLNYSKKLYIEKNNIFHAKKEASFVPEFGFALGNVSTKVYSGVLFRWGENIPKDYGATVIDANSYSHIPLTTKKRISKKEWSYFLNLSFKANLIMRNIFLDGNSIQSSHSVEKNIFRADVGYGFSCVYDHFSIDYLRQHSSKEFTTQESLYSYGSLLFTYHY